MCTCTIIVPILLHEFTHSLFTPTPTGCASSADQVAYKYISYSTTLASRGGNPLPMPLLNITQNCPSPVLFHSYFSTLLYSRHSVSKPLTPALVHTQSPSANRAVLGVLEIIQNRNTAKHSTDISSMCSPTASPILLNTFIVFLLVYASGNGAGGRYVVMYIFQHFA